jgi:hypothetical protein
MPANPVGRDALHLVLESKLALLQGYFFDLFGAGEVVLFEEFVEAIVKSVVEIGKLAILIVARQQEMLDLLRFGSVHGRTLLSSDCDPVGSGAK